MTNDGRQTTGDGRHIDLEQKVVLLVETKLWSTNDAGGTFLSRYVSVLRTKHRPDMTTPPAFYHVNDKPLVHVARTTLGQFTHSTIVNLHSAQQRPDVYVNFLVRVLSSDFDLRQRQHSFADFFFLPLLGTMTLFTGVMNQAADHFS